MKELTYNDLPSTWAFCFNEHCSMKDSCMQYITTKLIPNEVSTANTVLPQHYCNEGCNHYREKKMITVAWGFEKLFYDVKNRDTAAIRKEMMQVLGSRSHYYRCASGEKCLTPKQQAEVLDLFRQRGYTTNLTFDHYQETWSL